MNNPYFPLVVMFTLAAVVVLALLLIAWKVGPHSTNPAKAEPFESGNSPRGDARIRFSVKFYLIAMLFVIFDVETIFIFSWAIAFEELGWFGYVGVIVFVILLFVVLIYEWRNGALDFGPDGKKILKAYKRLTEKRNKK